MQWYTEALRLLICSASAAVATPSWLSGTRHAERPPLLPCRRGVDSESYSVQIHSRFKVG